MMRLFLAVTVACLVSFSIISADAVAQPLPIEMFENPQPASQVNEANSTHNNQENTGLGHLFHLGHSSNMANTGVGHVYNIAPDFLVGTNNDNQTNTGVGHVRNHEGTNNPYQTNLAAGIVLNEAGSVNPFQTNKVAGLVLNEEGSVNNDQDNQTVGQEALLTPYENN